MCRIGGKIFKNLEVANLVAERIERASCGETIADAEASLGILSHLKNDIFDVCALSGANVAQTG